MKNYIFISYAHRDSERVLPVIKKLQENGYNVWYDDGIDPGTEWAKNISKHIVECSYFIAFMSQAYLDSKNCNEEWHFARDEEKKRFLVYIEDIRLPDDMRMRSSMIQNLFMHKYGNKEEFYRKLFAAEGIEICKNNEFDKMLNHGKESHTETNADKGHSETLSEDSDEIEKMPWSVKMPERENETTEQYDELCDGVQEEDWEDYFETEESNGEIIICEYLEEAEEVVIPKIINGKPVTKIGYAAFAGCENLSRVVLPKGVREIEDRAFEGCMNLSSVEIPESVMRIGENAFERCESLSSIMIPESVREIGFCAFEGCENLLSIVIPKGVREIESDTFKDCKNLLSVEIPESVMRIGENAFERCESLTSIMIPKSVREIGSGAFAECTSLVSVVIPKEVEKIGFCAFEDCISLENAEIPKGVTQIGHDVFKGCIALSEE